MAEPLSGQVTAFFLFDVAEGVDLATARSLCGASAESPRLAVKPAVPAYVQYQDPPAQFDADTIGALTPEGLQARFKVYDYGVFSLSLTRPFRGSWADLHALAQSTASSALEGDAVRLCHQATDRLKPALHEPRQAFLSEDYFVYALTSVDGAPSSEALLATHGDDIARLLRGEVEPLSRQERDEVLRHRLSYFASDLVVPSWNGAFVYDTETGLPGALEILEFANSQLLQFRYYDQRLDRELTRIYAQLQVTRWYEPWIGRRYTARRARAARAVHRRQRAHRPDGERAEAGRGRLCGAAAGACRRTPRSRRLEGRGAGQAEDAR